jgi:anti-sigma regulatory factor (Ser/Thr protein kinase)
MKDISYHILDIVRNSLQAGAKRVDVELSTNSVTGRFVLKISDNGCGMSAEMLKQVTDPFFTTSVTKKVGLGLPLLKQHAELTEGSFSIESVKDKGTIVTAVFNSFHIDMIPIGDLAMTFKSLIASNPDRDFVYWHQKDSAGFVLDTTDIRSQLGEVNIASHEVLDYITDFIRDNLKALSI